MSEGINSIVYSNNFPVDLLLSKDGSPYHSAMLSSDWYEHMLAWIPGEWAILSLINSRTHEQGCWYFDNNMTYFLSDIKHAQEKHLNLLKKASKAIINDFILGIFSGQHSEDSEANSLIGNRFILTQLSKAVNIRIANNLYGILDNNHLRSQDSLLSANERILFKGKSYKLVPKTIALSNFGFAYFYKDENDSTSFLVMFETSHSCKRVAIYSSSNHLLVVTEEAHAFLLEILLRHCNDFYNQIVNYLWSPCAKKAIFTRNSHIGHNLWNDLSGLYRLERTGFGDINEIILFEGCKSEVYGPVQHLIHIPEHIRINRDVTHNGLVANEIYARNLYVVRIADDFIHKELANRIVEYSCVSTSATARVSQAKNQANPSILISLRLENRTWDNQQEGLLELCKYVSNRAPGASFIIDGHNYIGHNNIKISSHMEESSNSITRKELELFYFLEQQVKALMLDVKLVKSIDNDIRESIALTKVADFFIAPWGAGLAKYKWLCNKPGIIFTSRWNLLHKDDLHIYDSTRFREEAIPAIYVSADSIIDCGTGNSNTIIPQRAANSYANFVVNIDTLKDCVNTMLHNIGF